MPRLNGTDRNRLKTTAEDGFSLVELMLVFLISLIVASFTLSLHQLKSRYYLKKDALAEQTQNLKTALNILSREARISGNAHRLLGRGIKKIQIYIPDGDGGGEWFHHSGAQEPGVRPIFGRDGGAEGPDEITVFRTATESALPVGYLLKSYIPGNENRANLTLRLNSPTKKPEPGDIIAISDGESALIVEVGEVSEKREDNALAQHWQISISDRFRPGQPMPFRFTYFPPGSYVFNLKDIFFATYYVDTDSNNLMVRYHNGTTGAQGELPKNVILASNIEDMQLNYKLRHGSRLNLPGGADELTEPMLNDNTVKALSLILVSKSSYLDKAIKAAVIPAIFNRPARSGDSYHREIMVKSVVLMNF